DKVLDRDKSHSSRDSDKMKKQQTSDLNSTLERTPSLSANISSSQPINEEPRRKFVYSFTRALDKDENLSTHALDKDKFRGEFTTAVVAYSERFKSEIDERIST
ncbi:773_t:CDS:2, partial [Scutellospora calospora]